MPVRAWGFKSPLRHQVRGLRWVTTHKTRVEVVSPFGGPATPFSGWTCLPSNRPTGTDLAELLMSAATAAPHHARARRGPRRRRGSRSAADGCTSAGCARSSATETGSRSLAGFRHGGVARPADGDSRRPRAARLPDRDPRRRARPADARLPGPSLARRRRPPDVRRRRSSPRLAAGCSSSPSTTSPPLGGDQPMNDERLVDALSTGPPRAGLPRRPRPCRSSTSSPSSNASPPTATTSALGDAAFALDVLTAAGPHVDAGGHRSSARLPASPRRRRAPSPVAARRRR